MSYPVLYLSNEVDFNNNGIGTLSDCISCVVTEERNGAYELEMEYPMAGINADRISSRSIIKAKPNAISQDQLFRIYSISKPINGIFQVLAEHISYDLGGVAVSPFVATSSKRALELLKENEVFPSMFNFSTDIYKTKILNVENPSSVRYILGGSEGSLLDVYGGEFEFDNFHVILREERGRDNGVVVKYGKNLIDFEQEENCSNVFTSVYPFYNDGTSKVELPEKIINAPGAFNFKKIKVLDLTDEFKTTPTVEELENRAQKYIQDNKIGVPEVSLTVSFVDLSKTEEYKDLEKETIGLCDTIGVEFPLMGVTAKSKVIRTVFDALEEKYTEIELGSYRFSIADTIKDQQKEIEKVSKPTFYKEIVSSATDWLTNGKGYKVERRDANGNAIDTLYMDIPDIETAKNVLRIGQSGIGFSKSGVNGPYYSAWTLDGRFNADFIMAGVLSSMDGNLQFDLNGGELRATDEDGNLRFVIGQNGTKIFAGSLEIYNGYDESSSKALYVDQYGDLSFAGYVSYPNSPVKIAVRESDVGHPFFGVYNFSDYFLTDGAYGKYSPFFRVERVGGGTRISTFDDLRIGEDGKGLYINDKSVYWERREDGKYILVGE